VKKTIDFLFRPGPAHMALANRVYFPACLCFGIFLGTGVTVFAIAGMVWVIFHFLSGRMSWRLPYPVTLSAAAFAAFFAVELLAALIHASPTSLYEVTENLPFLGLTALYAVCVVERAALLKVVEAVAPVAAVVGLCAALPVWSPAARIELMAGNASVFAVLAAIVFAINLIALLRDPGRTRRWVWLLGAVAAAILVVASGTRAMWPALLVVPGICAICFRRGGFPLGWRQGGIALTAVAALAIASYGEVSARLGATASDLARIEEGDFTGSIGQRYHLWRAGLEVFAENPVLGAGPGGFNDAVADRIEELSGERKVYGHAHNAIITELVRAGVLGLAALAALFLVPLAQILKAPRDGSGQAGLAFLLSVQAVYVLSGTTGLAIGHDILDATFISATCYCLYLVFGPRGPERRAGSTDLTDGRLPA